MTDWLPVIKTIIHVRPTVEKKCEEHENMGLAGSLSVLRIMHIFPSLYVHTLPDPLAHAGTPAFQTVTTQ